MATQAKTRTREFPTHIDIPAEKRAALIEMLNQHLADTFDLYSQVKQAHWNVKGKDFYQLHLLFDEIAEEIEPFIDLLAERVTSLGGYATGHRPDGRRALGPARVPDRRRSRAASTSRPWSSGSASTPAGSAPASTRPTRSATPPPPTSTPRSPGSPTSGSGSSRPTSRPRSETESPDPRVSQGGHRPPCEMILMRGDSEGPLTPAYQSAYSGSASTKSREAATSIRCGPARPVPASSRTRIDAGRNDGSGAGARVRLGDRARPRPSTGRTIGGRQRPGAGHRTRAGSGRRGSRPTSARRRSGC